MEADTIVAIATPPGRGAISIVRLSGPESHSIVARLTPSALPQERRPTLAPILSESGQHVDDGLVTVFSEPHSYTGQDMAEISCHGSPLIADRIVGAALACGARAARPGEFTLRAFLNGRIDLTQAEAVVDLVDSRTDAGLGLALAQLEGELSRRIEPIRSELLDLLAHMTALVEFSEEDIPDVATDEMAATLDRAASRMTDLLRGGRQGQVLSHGVSLAIVGAPNVGKSSILNGLLGRERAIVTDIPGTTRDTVEEELVLGGILFRIVDTAGITSTSDPVEAIGISRSRQALATADVALLVVDGSRLIPSPDALQTLLGGTYFGGNGDAAGAEEKAIRSATQTLVVSYNKTDLEPAFDPAELGELVPHASVVPACAIRDGGLQELQEALRAAVLAGPEQEGFVVSNERHIDALRRASESTNEARNGLAAAIPLDLISLDVRDAVEHLGHILGVGLGDDVLDRVFSRFCIGK